MVVILQKLYIFFADFVREKLHIPKNILKIICFFICLVYNIVVQGDRKNKKIMKTKIEKIVIKSLSKKTWTHGYQIVGKINDKMDIRYTILELRDLIKWLRNKGYPIIANSHFGYKLAKNNEELEDYCIDRIREINDERHTLENMKRGK